MSIWMFVKTFGDICLYFSVISAFPRLFVYEFSFLWPALLCAVATAMADWLGSRGKPALRFLWLILPVASFALAGSLMECLILVLPVCYASVLVIRNMNYLEYYGFRDLFKLSLKLWAVFFGVICMLSYFEHATQPWRTLLDFRMPLMCGLVYMLCGVLLLRQLRMGADTGNSRLNGVQMACVMGAAGAVLLGLVVIERFLQQYATSIIELLKKAALYIVTAPLTVLTQLISGTLSGRFELTDQPPKDYQQYTEPPVEGGFPPPVMGTVEEVVEETPFPWWLAVLILLAMVAVLGVLAGAYKKRTGAAGTMETHGSAAPTVKRRSSVQRSNRAKLRQVYRSFLKHQRGSGLQLRHHYTSEDIQRNLKGDADPEAAALLRQVYLSARYDENREITAQQLKTARDALKRIRNGKETAR